MYTEAVKKQLKTGTPAAIIEVISTQMERQAEAARRIKEEGLVVRNLQGAVVPHPAIKIEQEAGKIIATMVEKHKARAR